jgi:hypothetical protein
MHIFCQFYHVKMSWKHQEYHQEPMEIYLEFLKGILTCRRCKKTCNMVQIARKREEKRNSVTETQAHGLWWILDHPLALQPLDWSRSNFDQDPRAEDAQSKVDQIKHASGPYNSQQDRSNGLNMKEHRTNTTRARVGSKAWYISSLQRERDIIHIYFSL